MTLRRGFKADANFYARDVRRELEVLPHSPLCAWKLADHLGFVVVRLSEFVAQEPEAVAYLQSDGGRAEFSAVTLRAKGPPWIVHNDSHHPRRQAANIAHEAAHGLLCHSFSPLTGDNGSRTYNREQEEEANWLGPALLISEEAALHIAEQQLLLAAACEIYGVSPELLQMRLRVTGAIVRVARRRAA